MWKTRGPSFLDYASNGTEPGSQNALNLWITCERNVEIRPPRICEKQFSKKFAPAEGSAKKSRRKNLRPLSVTQLSKLSRQSKKIQFDHSRRDAAAHW